MQGLCLLAPQKPGGVAVEALDLGPQPSLENLLLLQETLGSSRWWLCRGLRAGVRVRVVASGPPLSGALG